MLEIKTFTEENSKYPFQNILILDVIKSQYFALSTACSKGNDVPSADASILP